MKNIFKTIVGSQAYGTATPQSDIDLKGVYMQSTDDLTTFKYQEQINVTKDECYYEVRRFLQLLQTANPTVLEMLYMPSDCIINSSPQFEEIVKHRDKFLTKRCKQSFGGYAVQQIKKAKGLDKKMNWESQRVERKTPLDFCSVYEDGKTIHLPKWLEINNFQQELCGLVKLNHFKDNYSLYYDAENKLNFQGIVESDSNQLKLSSVSKELQPRAIISYNKDGYTMHCKDYNSYQTWLKERNVQRYVDNVNHNQKLDSKNIMHLRRLLDTALEIVTEKTINVRRPNAEYLLSIRRGEVNLDEIIEQAEKDLKLLDELFDKSDLPEDCDTEFVQELLLKIRHIETE